MILRILELLMYYDKDGFQIDVERWIELFSDKNYSRIALDRIGLIKISTVWLGINHNFGNGLPIIFETVVFHNDIAEDQYRYSNLQEAKINHKSLVLKIQEEKFSHKKQLKLKEIE